MIRGQNLFCLSKLWTLRRQSIATLILASLFFVGAARAADHYSIDPAHAFVTFTISHFSGKAKGTHDLKTSLNVESERRASSLGSSFNINWSPAFSRAFRNSGSALSFSPNAT